jgi:glycosyltransferase involved in cell wall biosynthesis
MECRRSPPSADLGTCATAPAPADEVAPVRPLEHRFGLGREEGRAVDDGPGGPPSWNVGGHLPPKDKSQRVLAYPRPYMKLVIQIPCHDEEGSLARTLAELPASVPGFDVVERILIDDGSTDASAEIARACGIDGVVSLPGRQGLARAFLTGLEAALRRRADVIVNTDADNQYRGADVARIVQPILEGRADMVVGERPIGDMAFSFAKRALQRIGSAVARHVSGTKVPDATSGFRAYTRDAALQINVFSTFSYTLETLIQLGLRQARIVSVPIRVNPVERPSRLYRSVPEFVLRQGLTIFRIYSIYRPFELFAGPGATLVLLGVIVGLRFLALFAMGAGQGHVQSLILASLLVSTGALLLLAAVLASLTGANRALLEDLRVRLRRLELEDVPSPIAARSEAPRPAG